MAKAKIQMRTQPRRTHLSPCLLPRRLLLRHCRTDAPIQTAVPRWDGSLSVAATRIATARSMLCAVDLLQFLIQEKEKMNVMSARREKKLFERAHLARGPTVSAAR